MNTEQQLTLYDIWSKKSIRWKGDRLLLFQRFFSL